MKLNTGILITFVNRISRQESYEGIIPFLELGNKKWNKLQKLEDALVEQMLTWLIRLTGLIGLTMRKM